MANGMTFVSSNLSDPPFGTESPVVAGKSAALRGLERAARPKDEMANFITHSLGFVMSVIGSVAMMQMARHHGDRWLVVACATYCASLVCLYGASALSHAFYNLHRRHFWRKIDQICIFYLIAGTYTPFAVAYLRHGVWPILTVAMWVAATLGAAIIIRNGYLSATAQKIYLLMGWLPSISLFTIVSVAPTDLVFWVVLGGLLYTIGTLFLWYDSRVRYFHATWHLFVIAASTAQYVAILLLLQNSIPL